jgi:hypothetical protein
MAAWLAGLANLASASQGSSYGQTTDISPTSVSVNVSALNLGELLQYANDGGMSGGATPSVVSRSAASASLAGLTGNPLLLIGIAGFILLMFLKKRG